MDPFDSPLPAARILTEGLAFAEGPISLPDGDLVVCEPRGDGLVRVHADGSRRPYASVGGGASGAQMGPDGAVYVCNSGRVVMEPQPDGTLEARSATPEEHARRPGRIERVREGGKVETLYEACDGRPLVAPNDIVFDRLGNFYFTDTNCYMGEMRERGADPSAENYIILHVLGLSSYHPPGSVYYASPDGRMIREVIHPLVIPNGVGLSPDEKTLYVAETLTARLWAFDIPEPGVIGERRCVGVIPGGGPMNVSGADSLVVDEQGNIMVGSILNGGITIFSPDGRRVRHVPTGDIFTTNACFGGPDMSTLFVTLGQRGAVAVFDPWPVRGLRLNCA